MSDGITGAAQQARQVLCQGVPVQISDRTRLEALIQSCPACAAEYSFANLYLYREAHQYRFIDDDRFPRIAGVTYDGQAHLLPLFALNAGSGLTLRGMLDQEACFYPVDEEQLHSVSSDDFSATSIAADSDYIFAAQRLASLEGAAMRRNQATRFEALHSPRVQALKPANLAQALHVIDGWLADVARPPDATDVGACREALRLREELGLQGLIVETGAGEPAGLLIAGALNPRGGAGQAAVHFAKGRRAFDGVYPFMFQQLARTLDPGIAWLNFEQDLGNEGFRRSKRAYAPARVAPKMRVRARMR